MASPYDPYYYDQMLEEQRRQEQARQQGSQGGYGAIFGTPGDWADLARRGGQGALEATGRITGQIQAPSPQTPGPGVPSGMAPPSPARPAPPRDIPVAPTNTRSVELDRLYEDYKQKVEHPDLGFAWGGGTPQAYRPGDDIRSGQYGAAPTEGAGIRAGTTENRIGGTAPQTSAGTFSQSNMEDIPIGQRPHSWFQDQQMQTELERMYADRARSKAMTEDPLGLSRYNYQFQAKDRQSAQLDMRKRAVMEDLQASIQAAMSDPSLPPERKEAEISRMRNEAYAEIESIDPRSDFKAYMAF